MRRAAILALLLASATAQDDYVRGLIAQLGAPEVEARADAAFKLGKLGPTAKSAASALGKALGDEYSWVADLAFDALKQIGPDSVPALAKALQSKDEGARARAMRLLDESFARDLKPHLRTIAGLLKDKSRAVRDSASHALAQQGEAAIDLLVGALAAREDHAQEAAITGLVTIGGAAVEPLLKALATGSERTRAGAASALGRLKASGAGEALFAALSDKSPEVGGAAALALGRIGALPDRAIPRLLEGLRSANAALREGCVDGLVAYGEPARDGLIAALDAEETRAAASLAILRGGETGIAALQAVLGGESVAARRAALAITRRMQPVLVPDGVIRAVSGCLRHDDPSVRAEAAATLAGIGPRAAGDLLTGAASDPDASVRAAAVSALAQMGAAPGHLDDPDPVVRIAAMLASWRLEGAPGAEELAKIAFDATAETRTRAAAVAALGDMGLAASSVDLTPLTAGQPVEIRRAAVSALDRITQPSAQAIREARTTAKPEKAAEAGLAWLASAQGKEGEWERGPLTAGTSGLALLAFLGAGHGPHDPTHGLTIRRGLAHLVSRQDMWGNIGSKASHSYMVCHGIATMALIEAWILSGDPRFRRAAQYALDYIAWARNPNLAWRYDPRGNENDTHVTTWMVTAMKLGDAAGLRVDRDAYVGAAAWIERMTGTTGRIGYTYPGGAPARPEGLQDRFPADQVETMTAAGLWCRQLLGGEPLAGSLHKRGIDLLLALPPMWNSSATDLVYWNFGALALFQDGDATYRKWEKALLSALSTGREGTTGAWRTDDVWSDDGGKAYTTAMGVLTLLTPTRYPRDFLTKPKLTPASRAAIAALRKACADEDAQVREIATAACARLGG